MGTESLPSLFKLSLTFLWYGQICVLIAVAILIEVPWHLQMCNSCFYQVSKSCHVGLLFRCGFGLLLGKYHENICCGYSLEVPQHMFLWRNKNINTFRLRKKAPYLELLGTHWNCLTKMIPSLAKECAQYWLMA